MIAAIHNELYIRGDHAKLSDNKLITDKVKMIFDIFLKILYIFKIVIIGVITDNNVRIFDDVFDFISLGRRKCGFLSSRGTHKKGKISACTNSKNSS